MMLMGRIRMPAMASPPHELGCAVHRPVEIGLAGDLLASPARLVLVDQARVQIGVDRHLLAGHGIQGKAGGHLGHTPRALGDHHEVDDDQDQEHHQTHRVVAADDELTEGLDHLARRIRAGMALEQHHPRRGHVKGQAQQRGHQQHRGKQTEVQWPQRVHHHQQHHQGQGNIESEEQVEQERWQRQHDHR